MLTNQNREYDYGKHNNVALYGEAAELAHRTWIEPGEKPIAIFGCHGHIGSTVGNAHRVPHQPYGEVHSMRPRVLTAPLPTAPVSEGRFVGDEWVHDPSLAAWAYASLPDAQAIRIVDHLASGHDDTWLVLSDRRLGVLIDNNRIGDATEPAEPFMITLWELPLSAVARISAVPLGRASVPQWVFRFEFTDSALDFAFPAAEDMAKRVTAALR
ncbi:hypothetical protein [Allokutzneria oryzae]|uniref:Uncharacterized protein n=1 Tax=Allokutzneria oryzae TaxID=1378989 RepID=A0ABV5ZW29_9PSEU